MPADKASAPRWRALPLGLALLLGAAALGQTAEPGASEPRVSEPQARLVLVSWDGAAHWIVERLLAEGRLPHLVALAARGVAAAGSQTSFPSKTAAGHAAIWTGTWPGGNGITGNEVPRLPRGEHTLLESLSGFSSEALLAEPLYVTAAKAGRRVVVLSATQSYPATPHLAALRAAGIPADRYFSVSGFEQRIAAGALLGAEAFGPPRPGWGRSTRGAREASTEVGETTFYLLAFDDPADPVRGLDSVLVRCGHRDPRRATGSFLLKPRAAPKPRAASVPAAGWSPPLPVGAGERHGHTFFRLFALRPDGGEIALYRRAAYALQGAASPRDLAAYEAAYPGFHDDPFWLYRRGGFGLSLGQGGDGTAENRVLELVAMDLDLVTSGSLFALRHFRPDLLFHYTPMSDSAGHLWMGALDPSVAGHDPALAARLWPYYARVFELQDAWLGALVAAAPPGTIMAVVSDHGMAGVRRFVHVNRMLEQAGLLAWDDEGRIDLLRTRALAPFVDFAVRVNTTEWKGGIVPPAEREAVLAAATAALLAARDPDTGRPVIARVFRPDEVPAGEAHDWGLAGPRAGDLFYDLAPGYYLQVQRSERVVTPTETPWGEGHHGFSPLRPDMLAIFYAAGPGLASGVKLDGVRHIDLAPTLAHLLGIPAPAQATGRVILEALARPEAVAGTSVAQ